MAQLIVQIDDNVPVVHELGAGVVTIGRDTDNKLIIPAASVSRHHAEIISTDGAATLRDLNSANGTTVNDESITDTQLKSGDIIHFGTVRTTFVVPTRAAKPEPRAEEMAPRRLVAKPWRLIGGAVLLVLALAVAAVLSRRPAAKEVRPQSKAAVASEPSVQKRNATKLFWDQIQQIERVGNADGRNVPLNQYPRLPDGTYDLGRLNDAGLESLRANLSRRAENASQSGA